MCLGIHRGSVGAGDPVRVERKGNADLMAFPVSQGRLAKIGGCKPCILKQGANRICAAACAEQAGMALFSVSQGA